MQIKFGQNIIDIIRLKYFKRVLNRNARILNFLLNFFSLFNYAQRETKMQNSLLRFAGAKIGKNVHISCGIHIYKPQNLTIGDNVIINDNNTFMCWNKITVEKNCFTSVGVNFVAGTHNVQDYSDVSENQDIVIGPGTWIGASCSIQGGAHIGCGSIVGTGAVVIGKKYSDFSILVGVPAKLLKTRTISETIYQPVKYNKKELFENV